MNKIQINSKYHNKYELVIENEIKGRFITSLIEQILIYGYHLIKENIYENNIIKYDVKPKYKDILHYSINIDIENDTIFNEIIKYYDRCPINSYNRNLLIIGEDREIYNNVIDNDRYKYINYCYSPGAVIRSNYIVFLFNIMLLSIDKLKGKMHTKIMMENIYKYDNKKIINIIDPRYINVLKTIVNYINENYYQQESIIKLLWDMIIYKHYTEPINTKIDNIENTINDIIKYYFNKNIQI